MARKRKKKEELVPEVTPLSALVAYVECVISAGLDLNSYIARRMAIEGNTIPSVGMTVAAYREAYRDIIGPEEDAVLILQAFVESHRDDHSLGLADFLESFLNEDGSRDRLVIELSPVVPHDPNGPLPGQTSFLDALPAEADAEPQVPEPPFDVPDDDPAFQQESAALAEAAVATATAAGSTKGKRKWAEGCRVTYQVGRKKIVGVCDSDPGDGRIFLRFDTVTGTNIWPVAKSRCSRPKDSQVVEEPPAAAEAEKIMMGIPEDAVATVAGWLASDFVDGTEPDDLLDIYIGSLSDNREINVTVRNGTPGSTAPYIDITVVEIKDDDTAVILFQCPPSNQLLGTVTIAIDGFPVLLELVECPNASQ
jgi:hypothetical protein